MYIQWKIKAQYNIAIASVNVFLCTVIHMMTKMFPDDMMVKYALVALCVNTISQV